MKPKPHKSKPRRDDLAAARLPLRRDLRFFLFLSLFYVSGLLVYFAPFAAHPPPPGAVYRSHEIFAKLWPDIESDNSSAIEISSIWTHKMREIGNMSCSTTTPIKHFHMLQGSGPSGYLIVEANGGLNQQRSAVCNAVAVAGLLNAVLVIPWFEFHSVWRDPSGFGDIFDVDHFISILGNHVKVIKELPDELMETYGNNITNIPRLRVQAWSPVDYYVTEVYPLLLKKGVLLLAPFANRLSMNAPRQVQLLRCFANYRALRFSSPISTLANKLVDRMIEKSSRNGGKYVSVHLRFEEDMVAFSCCVYDGGNDEKSTMGTIRQNVWKNFRKKDRVVNPGLNRLRGNCPLTPLEVGMMLRGMGFDENTSIYLASGEIYQAHKYLAPLLKMFPLLHSKESLATPNELAAFEGYSSRLAALDYTVCLHSEVFLTTQGGNFPQFLIGHRRFIYDGHAKTIMPDKHKLALLMQDTTISWEDLKHHMRAMLTQSDRRGTKVPKVKKLNRHNPIYTYPLPACQCLQQSYNSTLKSTNSQHKYLKISSKQNSSKQR